MTEKIGIIGNGGQADEAASFSAKDVIFRAVSKQYLDDVATVDIESPSEIERETAVCIAVGAPGLKRDLAETWPGVLYESIISEHACVDNSSSVGEGSIIAPRAVVTTSVHIGRHALLNVAATVQHNTHIGDYTSIGPGAHIAGNVDIGDGVYVGIGAVVSNDLRIANGAVIGAGATLLHDAEVENGVYIGTPARLLKKNKDWLHEV